MPRSDCLEWNAFLGSLGEPGAKVTNPPSLTRFFLEMESLTPGGSTGGGHSWGSETVLEGEHTQKFEMPRRKWNPTSSWPFQLTACRGKEKEFRRGAKGGDEEGICLTRLWHTRLRKGRWVVVSGHLLNLRCDHSDAGMRPTWSGGENKGRVRCEGITFHIAINPPNTFELPSCVRQWRCRTEGLKDLSLLFRHRWFSSPERVPLVGRPGHKGGGSPASLLLPAATLSWAAEPPHPGVCWSAVESSLAT